MTMGNHLRANNASAFLGASAAGTAQTVDDALHTIATDWRTYLIPGTSLVDYGPAMDGFSPTYKHVMPGCSQGNNAYMLRQLAALREAQGDGDAAAALRGDAAALSAETLRSTYAARDGRGFFTIRRCVCCFYCLQATDDESRCIHLVVGRPRHHGKHSAGLLGPKGYAEPIGAALGQLIHHHTQAVPLVFFSSRRRHTRF